MERPRAQTEAAAALDQFTKPSVAVAKQWFEAVILPRRVRDEKRQTFRLAEMGEDASASELFPVWGTSVRDLRVFGMGISLYFHMLLQLGTLLLVLAAVSTPSILYFASAAYAGPLLERTLEDGTKLDMRVWGTAVCTRWSKDTLTNELVHDCPLVVALFQVDLAVLGILAVYTIAVALVQERTKAAIDAQQQTAADYAVVVKDPNHDAWTPDEWHAFFVQFGAVKFVTVCVDNDELLSALARKRYMEERVRMESPDRMITDAALHAAIDGPLPPTAARVSCGRRLLQALGIGGRDMDYWTRMLYYERKRVERLLRTESYAVSSVFVLFETEAAHAECLAKTRAGVLASVLDVSSTPTASTRTNTDEQWKHTRGVPRQWRFRGTNILQIEQACEPTSVQWKSVGVRWSRRFVQQCCSVAVVVGMMVGVYYLTRALRDAYVVTSDSDSSTTNDNNTMESAAQRKNLYVLAYALAATDLVGCQLLWYVDQLEEHQTKERAQLSALNKLLLFRAFNGAVVIYLLTDFTDVLAEQNLLQIQAILIANLVTTPALQLVGLYNRIIQCVFAPRAKTQRRLNQYYSGATWQLAERYTQISKTVGTALFFKTLLPTGLVITALSLFLNYWVDKYCLLRLWRTPPKFDGLLARASRYHLLFMALTALVMMGHWYDGWPFDAAAERELSRTRWQNEKLRDKIVYVLGLVFPFERTYRSEEQTELMQALVLSIIGVTTLTLAFLLLKMLYRTWHRYVVGSHAGRSTRTQLSDVPASAVAQLDAYVPSYETPYADFPYLCVPLTDFEHRFIHWSGDHAAYCLVNDVTDDPALTQHVHGRPLEQLFGACKQYDDLSAAVPARTTCQAIGNEQESGDSRAEQRRERVCTDSANELLPSLRVDVV